MSGWTRSSRSYVRSGHFSAPVTASLSDASCSRVAARAMASRNVGVPIMIVVR